MCACYVIFLDFPPLLPQTANIDKLTKEMKQLKVIPHSWQPSDVTSPRAPKSPQSSTPSPRTPSRLPAEPEGGGKAGEEPSELGGRGLNGDVMQTPVIDRMLNSERLSKLRECLGNITHTPVRTLRRGKNHTQCYPAFSPGPSSRVPSTLIFL